MENQSDRLLPKIVKDVCRRRAIQCDAFSDNWVLRLQRDGLVRWIVGYATDINTAASADLAADKVGCYQALRSAGIPAVEHYLVRSRAADVFLAKNVELLPQNEPVIVKPLLEHGGKGVLSFGTIAAAERYVMGRPSGGWALSPRHEIMREDRYVVLDGRVLLVYSKTQPANRDGLPMFNLGQGAVAQVVEPDQRACELAVGAAAATGLRLCVADIVWLADGSQRILEVNKSFVIERFARQSPECYEYAQQAYEQIITAMMRG